MPIPRQAQAQIDEARAAHEAYIKGEPIPGQSEHDGEGEVVITAGNPVIQEPFEQQEPEPPTQEEPPTDDGVSSPEGDDEASKARHLAQTWRGRYRADVPALRAQVEELTKLTNRQFTAIAELQTRMSAPPPQAQAPAPAAPAPLVSEDERRQYGSEFSDFIERMAQGVAQKTLREATEKFDQRLERVSGAVERVDKRTLGQIEADFYRDLRAMVPDYEEIDKNPDFGDWLQQRDPYSGEQRKNLLANACGIADSARAAKFFTGFLAEQAATNPAPARSTSGNGNASGVRLESLAAPGRPRQPATREAVAPEAISEDQIRSFYSDIGKGRYRNRPQERADMARKIEAALLAQANIPMQ